MKVYVLERDVEYEGTDVIDIFKDESDANLARDKEKKKARASDVHFNVNEWDVK